MIAEKRKLFFSFIVTFGLYSFVRSHHCSLNFPKTCRCLLAFIEHSQDFSMCTLEHVLLELPSRRLLVAC